MGELGQREKAAQHKRVRRHVGYPPHRFPLLLFSVNEDRSLTHPLQPEVGGGCGGKLVDAAVVHLAPVVASDVDVAGDGAAIAIAAFAKLASAASSAPAAADVVHVVAAPPLAVVAARFASIYHP